MTNKIEFKTKRLSLTVANVETLKKIENPRPLSETHVLHLLRVLRSGKTFEGVFLLNDVSTEKRARMRLLDGNRRLQAIIQFLEEAPKGSVEIEAHVYRNLTEQQELELFSDANRHRPVTSTDLFFVMQDKIPLWAMVQKDFPVPVAIKTRGRLRGSNEEERIRFTSLVRAYLSRHYSHLSSGSKTASENLLNRTINLTKSDYESMKTFVADMVSVFGKPMIGNVFFKTIALAALAKVYYINSERMGREEVVRRFKSKVLGEPMVLNVMAIGTAGMIRAMTQTIVDACNKGYSDPTKLFVNVSAEGGN